MRFRVVLLFSFILLIGGIKADNTKTPTFCHTELVEVLSKDNFLIEKSFIFDTIPTINVEITQTDNDFFIEIEQDSTTTKVKFKRGKAILFTIFTGFLGGHRIYFGTHHRTPIIYSITFGGFFILPIIDLINIIFTKDLSKFENKPQIIMWGK